LIPIGRTGIGASCTGRAIEAAIKSALLVQLVTWKSRLGSLLKEEELLTWDKCRELEKMISIDLALIDETNFLEHRDIAHISNETSKSFSTTAELCADLRSLSDHLGSVLRKHCLTKC
jgi:hypothetical protein